MNIDDKVAWRVKQGNTSVQDVLVYDRNGNVVSNLASASAIVFQVKKNKGDAVALIEATLAAGNIQVNTPSTGWLRITLTPTMTAINPDEYFMGLQATWGAAEIYEMRIFKKINVSEIETDMFIIEEDVIT